MRAAAAAAVLTLPGALASPPCEVSQKSDCGFVGIDELGCERKGCCWEKVDPNPGNVPWCFLPGVTPAPPPPAPAPPGQTCDLPGNKKTDCQIGDQKTCEAAGCCWYPVDPNPFNVPWCFHPEAPAPPTPKPTPAPPRPPGSPPFTDSELATMKKFFYKNIDLYGTGMVTAAQDNHTHGGGSYWFHWMRDGALVMRALMAHFPWAEANARMQHYVQHVVQVQNEKDPNEGIDVRAEPKFQIPSGEPYTGGWCRPQNDGCSIRAGTLSIYALQLIANGETDYVRKYLYTGGAYNGGLIKYDLDYAVKIWNENLPGCDLWEEVTDHDFYWQWAHSRRGLLLGAQVAEKLGDNATAASWRSLAATIAGQMKGHVTQGVGGNYIYETMCCNRQKDVAGLLGALHDVPDDLVFPMASAEVANTIATLDDVFTQMFPINKNGAKLWGRYLGDVYSNGNPWVLSSFGKAQAMYRGATELLRSSGWQSPQHAAAWSRVAGVQGAASHREVAGALAVQGDAIVARIRSLVAGLGFHLPEQLDKVTGAFANAQDLTWSYAAMFDCLSYRSTYYRTAASLGMH